MDSKAEVKNHLLHVRVPLRHTRICVREPVADLSSVPDSASSAGEAPPRLTCWVGNEPYLVHVVLPGTARQ